MKRWVTLLCACVALPAMADARSRAAPRQPAAADLSRIDYALPIPDSDVDARPSDVAWRLPAATWEEQAEGDLRVKVKLRPNKAVGRVSLSF